jgi:hypothetical protein
MRPLTLAAAAAVIALAGCGGHAAASSPAGHSTATAASCHQQYETWKHGPAKAVSKKLIAALHAVQSAGSTLDIPRLASTLKKAGPAAAELARFPMPKCADPAGYFGQVLARVRAAADNAGSASGLASIMLAMVPLKGLPKIEHELTAELKRTAGVR